MQRAWAEIDGKQLISNLNSIKKILTEKTSIIGIVKADAYGHGAVEIARMLIDNGVEYLGVAWLREAEELRKNGVKVPIIVLSEPEKKYIPKIIELDLVQTVYHYDFVRKLSEATGPKKVKAHVKVDTGMNRIGLQPSETVDFVKSIQKFGNIEIEGLFTHFACADDPENELNKLQIKKFNKVIDLVKKEAINIKYLHAANSAAAFNFKEAHYDFVRIGIALYRGVMSFKSRVMFVKEVAAGTPVSYGATYVTAQKTKLATVSAGYADGVNRLLSNKGRVLIRGQEFPIVGTICMDMFVVDVTDSDVTLGDDVVIIGKSGNKIISAQDVADLINTIDYEIMCGISKRVPRIYL